MKSKHTCLARVGLLALACAVFLIPIIHVRGMIMPGFSILDNSTGGSCMSIGTWNNDTKTCTLSQDVSAFFFTVNGDNITLDGAGHTITSNIGVSGYTGMTIKNVSFGSMNVYNAPNTTLENDSTLS